MESMTYQEAIELFQTVEAVQCVETYEALVEAQRIPDDLRDHTFFSQYDWWIYISREDDKTCFSCTVLGGILFTGLELRSAFPWLRFKDVNTLYPSTHPNCRCILLRLTSATDYIRLVQLELLNEMWRNA